MFTLLKDDLSHPQSRDLVVFHLAGMNDNVPPGATFLGLSDLMQPEVTVWSAWENGNIASIGALKRLPDDSGEIKSMRTHPDFAGRGAGKVILQALIDAAREEGIPRLSLETGSGPSFAAATALYVKFGFQKGAAYSTHEQTEFNHFMHLELN
ncbi:GNAT family N-acetyltransferase [Pokkaliibacter sp. CJK22405]|uniref:GNAT family N-acetyltransferase n=1 Tax=Pokkaliibacter sp. CJK22405 TaxID=3384615 RepID=UPI00398505DF